MRRVARRGTRRTAEAGADLGYSVPMQRNGEQGRPRSAAQDWRVLLAVYFVTSLIEAVGVSQIYAFMPNRLEEVGLAQPEIDRLVGLLGSLFFVSGLPLIPLWGVWADKYSRKAIIIRSALVEAAVFGGVAASRVEWQLVVSMLLVGFQLGNSGVMMAAIRDATPSRRLGFAMGIFAASSPLGFGIGPSVGAFMIDSLHTSSATVYALSALLSLSTALLLAVGSREVRPSVIPTGGTLRLAFGAVRGVLADPLVRWLFLIYGIVFFGRQMTGAYVPLLVHDVEHTSLHVAGSIGVVLGFAAIAGALISPVGGWMADRVGFRRVMVASMAGLALAVLTLPVAPLVGWIAVGYALVIAFQAVIGAMVSSVLATELPAERRSATLNLIYLPLYFGGIVGPAVGSAVVSAGLRAVFYAAAAALAVGFVVAVLFARRAARKPAVPRAAEAGEPEADQSGTFISAGPT